MADIESGFQNLQERSLGDVVCLLQDLDFRDEEVEVSSLLCSQVFGLYILKRIERDEEVAVCRLSL